MEAEIIYIYEEMDSHMFQIVRSSGQVADKVDVITAEGVANRLIKQGYRVQWVDRTPSKERKYVRNLISQYPARAALCACTTGVSL